MSQRQFARSYLITTVPTYLTGTDARTNVVLDEIIVETYNGASTDTITVVDGDGDTLLQVEISTGRDTPFTLPVGLSSGKGMRISAGSPSTRARAIYFISSQRPTLPNGY